MTDEELKVIEERLNKATPGPWYSSASAVPWKKGQRSPFEDQGASVRTAPCDENADDNRAALDVIIGGSQDEQGGAVGVLTNEDADFIAHARTDIEALLSEIKRLKT